MCIYIFREIEKAIGGRIMADLEEGSSGFDIAELIDDICKDVGKKHEVIGSMLNFLLMNDKVLFIDLVSAVSYARMEWDI